MILAALVLLVVALAFVAAELLVPSHGVLTICAACAAITSIVLAFLASPALGVIFALLMAVASPVVVYVAVKIYPTTTVGKRVLLENPSGAAADAFAAESARLAELVGQRGTAVTTLRPAGSIEIGGRRIDALAESEVIDTGATVEVLRVSGLKVFVKGV